MLMESVVLVQANHDTVWLGVLGVSGCRVYHDVPFFRLLAKSQVIGVSRRSGS